MVVVVVGTEIGVGAGDHCSKTCTMESEDGEAGNNQIKDAWERSGSRSIGWYPNSL